MSADVSLAALFAWDTGASILPESYARLRQAPAYPRAVRRLIRTMLEAAADDPALDGIFKDAGRKVAALAVAHLHMSGGISLPRLKSLIVEFGLASPGRAPTDTGRIADFEAGVHTIVITSGAEF